MFSGTSTQCNLHNLTCKVVKVHMSYIYIYIDVLHGNVDAGQVEFVNYEL